MTDPAGVGAPRINPLDPIDPIDAIERIGAVGALPVVDVPDAASAVPIAAALRDGGLPAIEVTFRTSFAPMAIAAIRHAFPDMVVGAGTVLSLDQLDEATASGAQFIVSPGLSRAIVERTLAAGVASLPGVATATEVQAAIELGLRTLKFFPAEAAGGVRALRALAGPFGDVRFVPTGGIDESTLRTYLDLPNVAACGGSWFVRKEWLTAADFASVRESARRAAEIVGEARRRPSR